MDSFNPHWYAWTLNAECDKRPKGLYRKRGGIVTFTKRPAVLEPVLAARRQFETQAMGAVLCAFPYPVPHREG